MSSNIPPRTVEEPRKSPSSPSRSIPPSTRAFLQYLVANLGTNGARQLLHALRDHRACLEMNNQLRQLCESLLRIIEQSAADLIIDVGTRSSLNQLGVGTRTFNTRQEPPAMPRDQGNIPAGHQQGHMPAYLPDEATLTHQLSQNLDTSLNYGSNDFIEPSSGSLGLGSLTQPAPPEAPPLNAPMGSRSGGSGEPNTLEHSLRTGNLSENQIQQILSTYNLR